VKLGTGTAEQADHGHTAVYSTSERVQAPLREERASRAGRAVLVAEGKRHAIAPAGATIGRSRECDVVLEDSNISRKHAELRPGPQGGWTIADLGSTNGVRVNGHGVPSGTSQALQPGDHLALGTVDATFEVD
jgi:pSer/pThr/pTyr-binding forkhead associated (FHA) protein